MTFDSLASYTVPNARNLTFAEFYSYKVLFLSFYPFTFCTAIVTIHILLNFDLIVEEMEVELLVLVIDLKSGYVFLLLDIQYRCYYNMYKLSALFLIHALFYESA